MGGGGQRLNELKLFVERIAQKNGEKQWSFGYGTCQIFFFLLKNWLFLDLQCIWEYWEERGENDYGECHAQNFFWE